MPSRSFDCIVAGLGAIGSAAAYHCARHGARVLGIDRFRPPHGRGSHGGETRIFREAYFEDPRYVPLLQRAFHLWQELERESQAGPLFVTTGGLMIGEPDGVLVAGARRSARTYALRYEELDAAETMRRYPPYRLPSTFGAIHEPRAGILYSDRCISAHLAGATRAGAELRFDEAVTAWKTDSSGVRITTESGSFHAQRLVLTPGAWLSSLLPSAARRITVTRQLAFWFTPQTPHHFESDSFPIFILEHAPGRFFYGFPAFGGSVKLAIHHEGEITSAEEVRREVVPADAAALRTLIERFLPDLAGEPTSAAVCMYANTPDGHFIVDHCDADRRVIVGSACSGHGFKFASVLGEAIADLVQSGTARADLEMFRWGRWEDR